MNHTTGQAVNNSDDKPSGQVHGWDEALQNSQGLLKVRLEFETLISHFSAAMIHLPITELETQLGYWLKQFVEFLEVDRVAVAEYSDDFHQAHMVQSYSVPNVAMAPVKQDWIPAPSIKQIVSQGRVLVVTNAAKDLPPEIYSVLTAVKDGTRSFVWVPLTAGKQVLGNLVFATFRHQRAWPVVIVRRIRLIGEILANVLMRKRSQIALQAEITRRRQLEQRYSAILNTAYVGFWITDLDHRILEANDAYCQLTGFSRDEICAMRISDIDVHCNCAKIEFQRKELVEKGFLHHETQHYRKDGAIVDLIVDTSFLPEEQLSFTFFQDITELKRIRHELENRLEFEELISSFSAELIHCTSTGLDQVLGKWLKQLTEILHADRFYIIEYTNDLSHYRMIQFFQTPLLPSEPVDTTPRPNVGIFSVFRRGQIVKLNRLSEHQDAIDSHSLRQLLHDGTQSLIGLPLKIGNTILGALVMTSLTTETIWTDDIERRLKLIAEMLANVLLRNEAEMELSEHRRHLEQLVQQRSEALKAAQRDLIQNEQLSTLGKLTATVSHELRNPLGTIRSSLYSISQRLLDQDSTIDAIERAERNIERCDRIIEELLDYTRSQDLDRQPTRIDGWIGEVLTDLPPPAGVRVEKQLNAGIDLNLDRELFRRCLINLLTNAYQAIEVKKQPTESGLVTVITQVKADRLEIIIADNGVGVDCEHREKIFKPLFSTKSLGVGLGVPIAKRIVEQHGGVMTFVSVTGQGAIVTLSLPIGQQVKKVKNLRE